MASTPTSILVIGLALPPSPQGTALQSAVSANLAQANQSGYLAEVYSINAADPEYMSNLRSHLSQKTWDGILIGWGIRGNPDHTELFEKIINAIVEIQRPAPKLIFSLKPDGLMDALSRNFEAQT